VFLDHQLGFNLRVGDSLRFMRLDDSVHDRYISSSRSAPSACSNKGRAAADSHTLYTVISPISYGI
jgi:hypothetical protein